MNDQSHPPHLLSHRVFNTIDSDTNKPVNVMLEMQFLMNGQKVTEKHYSPVLLRDSKQILSVKVIEEDYFNFEMNFENALNPPSIIYVKKKYAYNISQNCKPSGLSRKSKLMHYYSFFIRRH